MKLKRMLLFFLDFSEMCLDIALQVNTLLFALVSGAAATLREDGNNLDTLSKKAQDNGHDRV